MVLWLWYYRVASAYLWIPLVVILGLLFLQRIPQKYNYPVAVTEQNRVDLYRLGQELVAIIALIISVNSALSAIVVTWHCSALNYLIAILAILTLATSVFYIWRMTKLPK